MTSASDVSRERALEIARDFETRERPFADSDVAYSFEELRTAAPNVYGQNLKDCWIVYAKGRFSGMIQSSLILAISKASGEIVYAGSANDEG